MHGEIEEGSGPPGEIEEGSGPPGQAAAPVEVRDLHKRFGSVKALDGVSLDVAAGTTVALLGPSGCGKTTLLRAIAGLEQPDSGHVRVGARTLDTPGTHMRPEHRDIGMVFQDWALFPHFDVSGNVGYGLTRDERQSGEVDRLLRRVGLQGLGDRLPHELSGGQQQRVALARALACRPPVLLLDEPFSNLDAELRAQVRGEVVDLLTRLDVTAVFVTHDQEEAFIVGHQVAVMRDGVIVQQATPTELYRRPATPWIAGFVGDANFLDGKASGDRASTEAGEVPLLEPMTGPVQVLVRPESIRLTAGDAGEIRFVEYYGHDVMHRVVLSNGRELHVRTHPGSAFERGSTVGISYDGSPTLAWPRP